MNLRYMIRLLAFKYTWRKANSHNNTWVNGIFNDKYVHVAKNTYGELNIRQSNIGTHLYIGNYCSIAGGVVFLLSSEHYINHISTFPFRARLVDGQAEAFSKGDIVVNDDVWIGEQAIIMSGVSIGQGAVIAAGAVVTKDVPPYALVGGVPAKIIKYRFNKELIDELIKIDYSKLNKELINLHINELYKPLTETSQLDWLPKK